MGLPSPPCGPAASVPHASHRPCPPRRPHEAMLEMFKAAGLAVVAQEVQEGLPQGLMQQRMYALAAA